MNKSNQKKNNNDKRVKPIIKVLSLVFTGKDQKGCEYDPESCRDIVKSLQESGCFDKLSVTVTIAKNRVFTEDSKGTMNLGRFLSYNDETGDVELLIMGKNTELVDKLDDSVIVPRVRVNRNSTEVTSILGFEVVGTMEA